jgi:broad specificity phosphatase PhoE
MSTIFLMRHGQASFGEENYDKLTEKGIVQAQLLAQHLFDLGLRFDVLCSGTLQRHLETTQEYTRLCEKYDIEYPELEKMEEFNEYDPKSVLTAIIPLLIEEDPDFSYSVEKMFSDKKSFQKVFEKVMMRWVSGDFNLPGLVTWEEFASRVERGIQMVMESHGKGKKIAIFSSGGPICIVARKALLLSNSSAIQLNWQIINASLTRFKCTHDRIMLMSFNEHAHLEIGGDNSLVTYR